MRGNQGDPTGYAAQGQGDAAIGRPGQAGGDAVDHFHLDTVLVQPVSFFAATAEDARVAALQTHHAFALARIAQHQTMNKRLRGGATKGLPKKRASRWSPGEAAFVQVPFYREVQPSSLRPRFIKLCSHQCRAYANLRGAYFQGLLASYSCFLRFLRTV